MAHEFETGFFVGNRAWHGLGNVLSTPPETIEEGMRQAGLDWKVLEKHIFIPNVNCDADESKLLLRPGCNMQLQDFGVQDDEDQDSDDSDSEPSSTDATWISDYKALVRDRDSRVLGVVTRKYHPLQNTESFAFFNGLLETKLCQLEAAGSLRGGRRIWVLARVNGLSGDVGGDDIVQTYLLLWNSHDGTTVVGVTFTAIRVVCMNTLKMSIEAAGNGVVKIRHAKNVRESLGAVQKIIDLTSKSFSLTLNEYKEMKARKLPIDGLKKYVQNLFIEEKPKEQTKIQTVHASEFEEARAKIGITQPYEQDWLPRAFGPILNDYYQAPGSDMAGQTVWGAYNAVAHFLDYTRGHSESTRLDSAWFGVSDRLRVRAHKEALILARS
jgi:phage/plasmid-like protein (TIGR03299 family)